MKYSRRGAARASLLLCLPTLAQAADAAVPASPAAGLLQVFIGLIGVLLLIAGTAWAAKRLGLARGASSGLLRVVSSASVGARERVVVMEVGEVWLVLGVASGGVNTLLTLPRGEQPSPGPFDTGFAARLHQLIEKRREK